MTNRTDARAYRTIDGWIAEFRMVHWACYRTIMKTDPKTHMSAPEIFVSEAEAENAAWRALRDIDEPPMVGTTQITGGKVLKFELAEKKLFKGRVLA